MWTFRQYLSESLLTFQLLRRVQPIQSPKGFHQARIGIPFSEATYHLLLDSIERSIYHLINNRLVMFGESFEGCTRKPARNVSEEWQEVYQESARDLCHTQSIHSSFGNLDIFVTHIGDVHIVSYLQDSGSVNSELCVNIIVRNRLRERDERDLQSDMLAQFFGMVKSTLEE